MDPIEHTEITAGLWHLRPPRESEAADLLALAADPTTAALSKDLPTTEPEAKAWLRAHATWDTQLTFSILESTTERWAGHITLSALNTPTPHICCRVSPWARRRGAATTALRCLTSWSTAILNLPTLTLTHPTPDTTTCHLATTSTYPLTTQTPTTHTHLHTP
ncbi:GNAT family N-acetyltransferase [Actinocorallia sp. API 0066]|uniref:GNAT family N-acetyltransferase n=1 Tax=Actinocorallia sp. API 0066 TaxID=2896846 RepID=UPI001E618349|nr:GNAT family N-acetyltransferase [Actinocorallia sp. API 0066]MCD0449960.1 GNAT family N-acetyltransferase [Actinocorallia sp. API 0066]